MDESGTPWIQIISKAQVRQFDPGQKEKQLYQAEHSDYGGDTEHQCSRVATQPPAGPDEGLLVLHDYASGALLLPEEVDREREVVLAEMRTRDSPGYRVFEASLGFEFDGVRVSERLPIGVEEVVRGADRESLTKRAW